MTPELRFVHWLRGYMDARRIGQTAIEGLTGQDVGRIRQELASATGELGLGLGYQVACQGQTIPLQEQQRVEHEEKQRAALQYLGTVPRGEDPAYTAHAQRGSDLAGPGKLMREVFLKEGRSPDCPAHDTRCTPSHCYFQMEQRMPPPSLNEKLQANTILPRDTYRPRGFA